MCFELNLHLTYTLSLFIRTVNFIFFAMYILYTICQAICEIYMSLTDIIDEEETKKSDF